MMTIEATRHGGTMFVIQIRTLANHWENNNLIPILPDAYKERATAELMVALFANGYTPADVRIVEVVDA
jgi:hypothetical protein